MEAFNLFNRANLNPPVNSDDGALDPTGGVIGERSGTAASSRQIQLGLRLVF